DTLYTMLAQKLRGFESCDAAKIHLLFVKGKGKVTLKGNKITVIFPRKAHNPILRVPWHRLPQALSWLDGVALELRFS
ncbi:MAG: hypothetical protein MUO52_05470, partial [Desulfobacterales bacterium]|nr:hypothetical protein [Desulfobacterales bacterium]